MIELTMPDPRDLPDVRLNRDQQALPMQHTTLPNIAWLVDKLGFTLRYDLMACRSVYAMAGADLAGDVMQEQAELAVMDMCTRLGMKGDAKIRELLGALARLSSFHPMEEWLQSLPPWQGDPLQDLIDSVTTGNELWPVYVENWLVQVVDAVCGWRGAGDAPRSLPYVLVLVGGQGLGKSHWLSALGGRWITGEAELHLSSPSGKDHQIAVLRKPMAELSELDGIFRKSDISHMKAFISREVDEIRAPYERKALVRPRMTVFCGSVNDAEFLNDPTGSRRFWPVAVSDIDWSFSVDFEGLWSQAYALWQQDADFALDAAEDRQRAVVAVESHTLISPEQEKIVTYYAAHKGSPKYPDRAMNRTEIMEMLFGKGRNFWARQVSEAGRVLADLIGKPRTINGKQRAWMFPYNEFAADISTWPDNYHIKSADADDGQSQ